MMSPVSTWSVRKTTTAMPNTRPTRAPASMATGTPAPASPVWKLTTAPVIAPTSIMPSQPRLRTPARSLMIRPSAASR